MENLGSMLQMTGNNMMAIGNPLSLATLFEGGGLSMDLFTSHESGREENFLVDLFVLLVISSLRCNAITIKSI